MKKPEVIKSATITNNVLNGSISTIQFLEENLGLFRTRYVIQIIRNTTEAKLVYFYNKYEEALEMFIKEIGLATIL